MVVTAALLPHLLLQLAVLSVELWMGHGQQQQLVLVLVSGPPMVHWVLTQRTPS